MLHVSHFGCFVTNQAKLLITRLTSLGMSRRLLAPENRPFLAQVHSAVVLAPATLSHV